MSDDLRARLIADAGYLAGTRYSSIGDLLADATDRIEALEAETARLRGIASNVAAMHPQNGYACMWCHVEMNNHELPPATYPHADFCVWLRASRAGSSTPLEPRDTL